MMTKQAQILALKCGIKVVFQRLLRSNVIILIQFYQHVTPCTICVRHMKNMVLCLILRERVDPEHHARRRTKR
jgi:hypothetical protein